MAKPFMGPSARIFSSNMSSAPCTRPAGLLIWFYVLGNRVQHTLAALGKQEDSKNIPIVPVEFSHPLLCQTGTHAAWKRFRDVLRGRDVQEPRELQRRGMSIQAISELTGWDRKRIRKQRTKSRR